MRGFKGILLAIELPRRDRASTREKFDLSDVNPDPLICLTCPGYALALKRTEMRLCRSRCTRPAAGKNDIVGDGTHGIAKHVVEYAHQRVFTVPPLLATEEQEDMLVHLACDTIP